MTAPQPGQFGEPDDDRRSFASRTPVNENPDQVVYRRGFITKHQVSGWRFMMRRIASGVALHDTRMLVEPLRVQSRAVLMGVLIMATIAAGCFAFTLIWPNRAAGNDQVLSDRSSSALYVRLGDELHPVLNLTSARLIAGRPVNPTAVKTSALDTFRRGNLIGIPGAPERMVQSGAADADWTVCDAVSGPATGVTLIAGPPVAGGARAVEFAAPRAVLAENATGTWLLWDGKRSRISLRDRAVTGALGLGAGVPGPRRIAAGLLNTIPEAPALTAPVIPEAGGPPQFDLPLPVPVGAVVATHAVNAGDSDSSTVYYAVLSDGLQPISGVLAAVLRNTDSYGLDQPPALAADVVARLPVSQALDTSGYPDRPVTVVDPASAPVTCAAWRRQAGAGTATMTLLSGSALPLPDRMTTLDLVGAGTGGTARRVALTPGVGYFTRSDDALFWISDTGVRYGISTEPDGADNTDPVAALGLARPPLEIPWSVLAQFALGPTLSRADALLAHDGLPPDQRPTRRVGTAAGGIAR